MKNMLQSRIEQLSQGRILVLGDIVIDEMVYGDTHRISREAPVLILKHQHSDIILGGAGNAAHNIASLHAKHTAVIGVCGNDYYASLLKNALQRDGIDDSGLITDPERPTSTKTRISGIANHSITQQVVRIDRESNAPVSKAVEAKLLQTLTRMAPDFDGILISDYGLGVVTPALIECCKTLKKQYGLVLAVDSQQDLKVFSGATIITPNQPEAEQNSGFLIRNQADLFKAGRILLNKSGADNVLITCGESGMCLFETVTEGLAKTIRSCPIPVFNHSEVFDVIGAGDTVVGTMVLALVTGASLLESALLGNLAASIVVKRYGAATTTTEELKTALKNLDEQLLNTLYHSLQPDKTEKSVEV
jgi:D-glycero-beta-D-manno-heptose-7-phosphate kinase